MTASNLAFSLKRVRSLMVFQARELYRDFGTLFLNLIFPVLFVVGLIVSDLANPTLKFKIGVVEQSQDHASQQFVQALTASPGIQVKSMDRARSLEALKQGDVHVVFAVLDAAFDQDKGRIEVIASPRYEPFSQVLLDSVRERMARTNGREQRVFDTKVVNPPGNLRSDFTFTFPGLLALAMVQLGLFATAVPLMQARDRGTLRYLSLTPLRLSEMLVGQVGLRAGVAMLQVAAILVAGSFMMSLSPLQWAQVFGISALGVILLVSIGYAIAGIATSPQSGTALILVLNFTMLMGGNIFSDPRDSALRYVIASCIPISYLSDLYRQVMIGELGVWPAWLDFLAILGVSAAAALLAVRTFRFDTTPVTRGRPSPSPIPESATRAG